MRKRTAMRCVVTLVVATAGHPSSAQEPPPAPRPPVADPGSAGEAGGGRPISAPHGFSSLPPPGPRHAGKGSFGLTEIAFPWGEVGLTSRVSVRVFAVPPLGDLTSAGVVIEPRIQLYGGARVQAALGVIQLLSPQDSGGIGYGVLTLGDAGAGLTLGYGYGYGGLADSGGSRGVIFLGAEKALGRQWRLIAEGYVGGAAWGLPDQTILGGFRFSRGRFSTDLAVAVPFYETGSGSPGPVLDDRLGFLTRGLGGREG